jgi:hypothetical protein
LAVVILPSTVALFHYHHDSLQPNGSDIPTANGNGERKTKGSGDKFPYQQPFPVYVISEKGLTVYDPRTKSTYLLRDGTSWRTPQGCMESKPKKLD